MKVLVTGSSGHLGHGLVDTLRAQGHAVVGIDVKPSDTTSVLGSISDRPRVARCMEGVEAVLHAATLHKPHVATHSRQDFVDVNVTGTLNLLEEAAKARVKAFVYTSTTSVFGDALVPPEGEPAAWITEEVTPAPKNIYGVTKAAAEDLCQLFFRNQRLPCLVLRTSRFFPEEDDNKQTRSAYSSDNAKANEYLYRRVDVEDVVSAHLLALERAPAIGFSRYVISATSPFTRGELRTLRTDAPAVVRRHVPAYETVYRKLGWTMFPGLDRVYVNDKARTELGWAPKHTFSALVERLARGEPLQSALAQRIGVKGYHDRVFQDGPFPVEERHS